jgi:hypothetical protein
MGKNASLTVRLPIALKRAIEQRADAQRRSVSSQVVHDLEAVAQADTPAAPGRFLGLFKGSRLPTDREVREARERLWGRLGVDEGDRG